MNDNEKKRDSRRGAGAERLRAEIIVQAKADYIKASNDYLKASKKNDEVKSKNAKADLKELERFFGSDWCYFLTGGIDPEKILSSLAVQARYAQWRKDTGCPKCKNKNCIHRSGEHYTVCEKSDLYCERITDESEIQE